LLILTPSAANLQDGKPALAVDGLAISDAEYSAGLRRFIINHPDLPDPEEAYRAQVIEELLLLAYVRDELAMKEEEFRYQARAELRERVAALVIERVLDQRLTVTEEEVLARYTEQRDQWVTPARVVVELILVATLSEADSLLARLESGEGFDELARTLSLHSSSQRGGRLEPFRRGTYSAALEDLAFSLKPGETGTTETERGVFILRKIADSAETITPYKDVRDQIEEDIRREKKIEERERFLTELRNRYSHAIESPRSDQ
jgi:parvulin-like peptidyl-prolyl isomerase